LPVRKLPPLPDAVDVSAGVAMPGKDADEPEGNDGPLVDRLGYPALLKLMLSLDQKVTQEKTKDGHTVLLWRMFGGLPCLVFSLDGTILIMRHTTEEPRMAQERVNDWNRNRFCSRSYSDADGVPVIECDVSLEGGVTRRNIVAWMARCISSVATWYEEVVENPLLFEKRTSH
jgi:hypothetical protein